MALYCIKCSIYIYTVGVSAPFFSRPCQTFLMEQICLYFNQYSCCVTGCVTTHVSLTHYAHSCHPKHIFTLWVYLFLFYAYNYNSCVLGSELEHGWPTLRTVPKRILCRHGVLVYTNNIGKLLINTLLCSETSVEKSHSGSLSGSLLMLFWTTSPSWLTTVLTVVLVKHKGHCRPANIQSHLKPTSNMFLLYRIIADCYH